MRTAVIECPTCHGAMTVEEADRNVGCPHCAEKIRIEGPERERPPEAQIVSERKTSGGGLALELVGFVLLFVFPIGTIIGLCLIVAGYGMSKRLVCGSCGNPVAGAHVRLCPTCRCTLAKRWLT